MAPNVQPKLGFRARLWGIVVICSLLAAWLAWSMSAPRIPYRFLKNAELMSVSDAGAMKGEVNVMYMLYADPAVTVNAAKAELGKCSKEYPGRLYIWTFPDPNQVYSVYLFEIRTRKHHHSIINVFRKPSLADRIRLAYDTWRLKRYRTKVP